MYSNFFEEKETDFWHLKKKKRERDLRKIELSGTLYQPQTMNLDFIANEKIEGFK